MKQVWLLIAACCCIPAFGQNLNFIHYNSNNSRLPHDVVYSVFQSSEDYLWIGTDDGLARFDGQQMKPFDKGLASRYTIAVDEYKGQLWVSTWKGGIHRVFGDSVLPVKTDFSFIQNTNRLVVHKNLVIAYSFSTYTLLRFDTSSQKLEPIQLKGSGSEQSTLHLNQPGYLRFLKRRNDQLLAYGSEGIFQIKDETCYKRNSQVWDRLYESHDGRLYGLQGSDLMELENDLSVKCLLYHIPADLIKPEHISYIYVLPTGTLCVGNEPMYGKSQHFLINPNTDRHTDLVAEVETHSPISTVYADKEGSIWLCTDGDGVYHIFDPRFQLVGPSVLTINPHVTELCYDTWQKRLIVGTRKGVIALPYPFSEEKNKEVLKQHFFTNRCFPLDNSIGISEKGFNTLKSFAYENGRVKELDFYEELRTPNYRLRSSYQNTFTIYSLAEKEFYQRKKDEIIPFTLYEVSEDDQQRIWASCESELFLFDWEKGWKKWGLWKGGIIHALHFEKGKGLWVGSASGLYLLSEKGITKQWTEKEGLHNVNVNCLYRQKGKGMWLGTQNGLYLLDEKEQLHLFKKRNGLIADDVLCFAPLPDGFLAVGSSKGLTLFYTDAPPQTQEKPQLLIDEVKINGERAELGRSYFEVDYNSTFEVGLNSITFLYPELLVFEYRLNPSDAWISTENRSIILTGLEAGTYKLALRVKKFDAGYSEPVTLVLRVLQPWWQNTYFYLLLILLLAGTSAYIIHSRAEKHSRSLLLKKELADLKLKSLLTQLNPHFVSNSLNAIQYYILSRDEKQANLYLSKFASLTRLILESSRHRFIALKSEVEILETYLSLEKLRFENRFDYSIHIDENLFLKTYYLPGIVVQPFAENSINHGMLYLDASITGQLDIRFLMEGEGMLIQIDDNGVGRKRSAEIKEKQSKTRPSLGGSIVEEISQTINELPGCHMAVSIYDRLNEEQEISGTRVEIRLQIEESLAEEEYRTKKEKTLHDPNHDN